MAPPLNFQSIAWQRFIEGPDPELLDKLYVPMLSAARRYDRSCGYFSSSVLSAAARGFAAFIRNWLDAGDARPKPAVRLLVNEEMREEDVRALTESGDISQLETALLKRLKTPRELLDKQRLGMLAWLYREGALDIRVGVMRGGGGIVHGKFGLATDDKGDAVVFQGSSNESGPGLIENYEDLDVTTSWDDPARLAHYRDRFDALWSDTHATVHTMPLPEAVRRKIIRFAPDEPPVAEPSSAGARQRGAMIWNYLLEAPYLEGGGSTADATALVSLWPHQKHVVQETASAWPSGRLLCDEVGMGKTIEAILILRRLMAGRGVKRALILLPAGLLKQWQSELREKGGLDIPRLENLTLLWPDGRGRRVAGIGEALEEDLLIMSRETARTPQNLDQLLAAASWDLVLMDEAHAARRKEQQEGEYNSGTLLLDLLRRLQLSGRAKSILLLSATPMQTHPWEPWDLLAALGEGGRWLAEFAEVRNFYQVIAGIRRGFPDFNETARAARLITSDSAFPSPPLTAPQPLRWHELRDQLNAVPPTMRAEWAEWMRRGAPLGRRMHRNTRETLRRYYDAGLLDRRPPHRSVADISFDFEDAAERRVYESVKHYINRRFDELEQEKPGKGFVMTVYSRRASSSPKALDRSLRRRREALLQVARRSAWDPNLLNSDIPEALEIDDVPEGETGARPNAALPADPSVARAEALEIDRLLEQLASLNGTDTKLQRFFEELHRLRDDGRSVLVFTEYTDTMEYLRDLLRPHYGAAVGCYSGGGGQILDGEDWKTVSKTEITSALRSGRVEILVCTDAASEGLNLQSAGALVNYDLPWNPSRVEQRIGRVDRIGQERDVVYVVNLFLENSVDDRVYRALRKRCGLFEHFVGAMQPVLAQARRMLRGQEQLDISLLETQAQQLDDDPLAEETYVESAPAEQAEAAPFCTLADLKSALLKLDAETGVKVRQDRATGAIAVSGPGFKRRRFSDSASVLDEHPEVVPLTPLQPALRELAAALTRPGECLPLIVESANQGAFRSTVVRWVENGRSQRVKGLKDLKEKLETWSGDPLDPAAWGKARRKAKADAERIVAARHQRSVTRQREALEQQVEAARIRLLRELGRFLVCLDHGSADDLQQTLYREVNRKLPTADRLRACWKRLTGSIGRYPEWPDYLRGELRRFVEDLPADRRRARLAGSELDAALRDPRWAAAEYLSEE